MSDTAIPVLKPAMADDEVVLLKALLGRSKTYLEFGCGGSTLLAVRSAAARIWSVETDAGWIERLRRHPEIGGAESAGRLTLVRADIGPTGAYGRPKPGKRLRYLWPVHVGKWPSYHEAIWSLDGPSNADLVLVDGRFRVASALAVLQHGRSDAIVAIHDFAIRSRYAPVLEFFDTIDSASNLIVLKARADIDPQALADMARRYRFNPD